MATFIRSKNIEMSFFPSKNGQMKMFIGPPQKNLTLLQNVYVIEYTHLKRE